MTEAVCQGIRENNVRDHDARQAATVYFVSVLEHDHPGNKFVHSADVSRPNCTGGHKHLVMSSIWGALIVLGLHRHGFV